MSGVFITFEGLEACGKSTQSKLLADRLTSIGYKVKLLREPGGTPIGEEIRHTLIHSHQNASMSNEAELLLMSASRAQLVREIIRPALTDGNIVLCDRFYDSTVAYQGYGRQLDMEMVNTITNFAVGSTRPDITILLDIPLDISEVRRAERNIVHRDRLEEADQTFFIRVASGFKAIADANPARVKLIDGTGDIISISETIWKLIQEMLSRTSFSTSKRL